ncbi:aldehyde dehydrogenase family protein [Pseudomonas citronellolis]|uniref:aldehyde dehydrogenase family protein n=1 Tax=Pseudomonas citronellolis TaxID=53408 RepID=UPI0021BF69F9|nr:aldehyde dehydrogenase family protein [Pseudomonas citronellolis]UXJ50232.1 aldehyde dehydrogenase family protein [Pseudomonas citronellolis]
MIFIPPNPAEHAAIAATLPKVKLMIGDQALGQGSGGTFSHVNTATGQFQMDIPLAGEVEVGAAVQAARAAFPGWRDMKPGRRRQILDRFADLIEQNMDRFMKMAVVENGIPLSTMLHGMGPRITSWVRYYAGWADKIEGLVTGTPPGDHFEYTVPEPYGVIGHIITWNAPLLSLAMKIPPSLAAGNTVVIKPAEFTPFSSQLFVELAMEAGVPPGVINVMPGGVPAGEALVRHPGVDKISFTGGPVGARAIMRSAAETLKPLVFELGGKSANVVFPDVDIASTAAYCAAFGLSNSGQGCALPTRMMIHQDIYEPFIDAVRGTMEQLPYGDPLNENVIVGPMVNADACRRVQGMIDEAREGKVGRFLMGDVVESGQGNFVTPTLIAEADPYCTIAQKEVFGPVLCAFRFADENEAVTLANATEYGLAAYVQTNDLNVAQRMVRRLQAGTVFVNQATPAFHAASPFGGLGVSGFGREGGKAGLEEFIRIKGVGMSIRPV